MFGLSSAPLTTQTRMEFKLVRCGSVSTPLHLRQERHETWRRVLLIGGESEIEKAILYRSGEP